MRTKFQILTDVLGHSYETNREQLFHCPYCEHHKKKFSVNIEKGFYKCWVCDARGKNLGRLVRQFGSFEERQEWNNLSGRVDLGAFEDLFADRKPRLETLLNLPQAFVSLASKSPLTGARGALNYLNERGIGFRDILRWKIGYCETGPYHGRIVVPSFNGEGNVNYFIARSYTDAWPKYKNPPAAKNIIFNELYVDWDSPVVIVEGIFDAIKAGNAIPLLGSTIRENSKLFQEIVKKNAIVYLALDPDAKNKTVEILKLLLSYDIEVYMIDVDGYDDVGEMTKDIFEERRKDASFVSQDDYLLQKLFML